MENHKGHTFVSDALTSVEVQFPQRSQSGEMFEANVGDATATQEKLLKLREVR